MNAVNLKDVTFSYDGKTNILERANFHADFGKITLISGHSGEGKSTLLSIISGIVPNINYGYLQGEAVIDSENIRCMKIGDICRKVGVVLQNADEQIVHKLVGDEIAFGCENLAFPPEKIEKQIEVVCKLMKIRPEWKTRTLSGGQKQRLITASTLAMGQKIVILDEPLANLDSEGANILMGSLSALAKAGYCIIVAEHRLDVVLPYVDKVWHMSSRGIAEVSDKRKYLEEQTKAISDSKISFLEDEPLIKIEDVSFNIGQNQILKSISCDIPRGGRVVLLGENGCGKTTLIRLIAKLYKPVSGHITQFIDEKLKQKTSGSKAWFKRVGVVYQNPDYQLFMPTVMEEIAFGAVSPEYADKIIEMFDLAKLVERHPHSLSQGQKRRVSIAAVAACRPELLLLDEPTVGQDYEGLCELVRILNELHEETGNTMITITHDMRCAEALCDKAILMEKGMIKNQGGKELVREYFYRQFN